MRHGAWWYGHCGKSNLNETYFVDGEQADHSGIGWYDWKGNWKTMKRASMKIRPNN